MSTLLLFVKHRQVSIRTIKICSAYEDHLEHLGLFRNDRLFRTAAAIPSSKEKANVYLLDEVLLKISCSAGTTWVYSQFLVLAMAVVVISLTYGTDVIS